MHRNQTSFFCSPSQIDKANDIIAKCNVTFSSSIENEYNEPPVIPDELLYQSDSSKLKIASDSISRELIAFKKQQNIDEKLIFSSIFNTELNFADKFQPYISQTDQSSSIFSFLARNHPEIQFPNKNLQANEVLYSIYFLSPKSPLNPTKNQLQHWILALSSNTFTELFEKTPCPLCKISDKIASNHRQPRKIQINEKLLYDFEDQFKTKLGDFITHLNTPISFTSEGGCYHHLIVTSAFAVHSSSNEKFPSVIGGRGSSPSFCSKCGFVTSQFAYKETESRIQLLCRNCAQSVDQSLLIDLDGTFFKS